MDSLTNEQERIKALELLVEELMKPNPREDMIRSFMEGTGLDYVEDPVDRINYVLQSLQLDSLLEMRE